MIIMIPKDLLYDYWKSIMTKDGRKDTIKREIIHTYLDLINFNAREVAPVIAEHTERIVETLSNRNSITVIDTVAKAVYRVRHGTSNYLLPLEWGLTLHPIYKVPYIPGSAVKGVLRAAFISLLFEKYFNEPPEEEELREFLKEANKVASHLFGSTNDEPPFTGKSLITAYDSYPIEPGIAGLYVIGDVLTPHYPTTRELKDELDAEPRPIIGLSVAEGTRFRFVITIDKSRRDAIENAKEGVKELLHLNDNSPLLINLNVNRIHIFVGALLMKAFREVGVGGKTTRGYGYFSIVSMRASG
ncbi:hypothetical protein IPA_02410 [Ignicoccus pacificus DSM 13166]|uniref:CRISPR type III-associated protein domain-containing protein n=1 Tax=Ignicoccus pacificus DSM 13166 TaxID=940294 RepID=A0A977PJW6_9CREN|nr:hypothetical protein IPA_02410 [Ignicoccus pacificus DSM 13166]